MAKNGSDGIRSAVSTALAKADDHSLMMDVDTEVPDGFECQIVRSLNEGKMVMGEYLGAGSMIESTNQTTGEVSELASIRLKLKGGIILDIPESAQLRRLRSVTPGKMVRIARLAQVKTRLGRMCNDFKIDVETDEAFTKRTGKHPAKYDKMAVDDTGLVTAAEKA